MEDLTKSAHIATSCSDDEQEDRASESADADPEALPPVMRRRRRYKC